MDISMKMTKITQENQEALLPMIEKFYQSPAVDHPVEREILQDTVDAVAEEKNTLIEGYYLQVGEDRVGYALLAPYFSCEVGGLCVMIEELYLEEEHRGKGYGNLAMETILQSNPKVRRFRLEVASTNEGAKKLYRRLGFEILAYQQMIQDSPKKGVKKV